MYGKTAKKWWKTAKNDWRQRYPGTEGTGAQQRWPTRSRLKNGISIGESSGGIHAEGRTKIEQTRCFKFSKLGVEMDIEARDGGKERDSLLATDFRRFQTIMMQYPIIDSFCRSALLHFLLKAQASPWDSGEEPQIPVWLSVDNPSMDGEQEPQALQESHLPHTRGHRHLMRQRSGQNPQ